MSKQKKDTMSFTIKIAQNMKCGTLGNTSNLWFMKSGVNIAAESGEDI